MTPDEKAVLDALAEAWNRFRDLPVAHDDDTSEFRSGIHALQDKIAARPTWRALRMEAA